MSRPNHMNRQNIMIMQQEIIQKKKREILERQQQQQQQQQKAVITPAVVDGAEKVVGVAVGATNPAGLPFKNTFNNDGSFLENFKKLTQAASYLEQNACQSTEENGVVGTSSKEQSDGTPAVIIAEQDNGPDKQPNTVQELVEMVVAAGDGDTVIEDRLRSRKNLPRQLWFLFDLTSSEYKSYRSQVDEARRRHQQQLSESTPIPTTATLAKSLPPPPVSTLSAAAAQDVLPGSSKMTAGPFVTVHRGAVYRDEDDDTEDSDTEYRREAKERNLKNMKKRLVCHYEDSDSSSSDQMEKPKYEGSRFNQDNFMPLNNATATNDLQERANASSFGMTCPLGDALPANVAGQQQQQQHQLNKKRKKSRWDEDAPNTTTTAGNSSGAASSKRTKVDRSDPEVIKLAVNSFGSVDLDEEQWEKVEQQFQIRRVYNEMLAKRQEIDRLAKSGRFKYEYDSDEDLDGGTWEHKMRKAEMESTRNWADATTTVNQGRHHIGDFLPPDELKKFLDQHDKKKGKDGGGGEPTTDYQDKKLTEENKGFQMLQKLGWKDGEGLGASGSGIVNPINKSAPRESNQGLGVNAACSPDEEDNEYDAYRKRMMLAYRFRPNPMNNPRRAYY